VGEDIVFLATDINLPGAVDWVMMQCCFDKYFILVLEKQEKHDGHQQFFAVVQLIGAAKDAEEFRLVLGLCGLLGRWKGVKSMLEGSLCFVLFFSDF